MVKRLRGRPTNKEVRRVAESFTNKFGKRFAESAAEKGAWLLQYSKPDKGFQLYEVEQAGKLRPIFTDFLSGAQLVTCCKFAIELFPVIFEIKNGEKQGANAK